jgi:hypothetical protein
MGYRQADPIHGSGTGGIASPARQENDENDKVMVVAA